MPHIRWKCATWGANQVPDSNTFVLQSPRRLRWGRRILLGCQMMVSPDDVIWWNLLTMSDGDISWRCQMMISPDDVRWWYLLTISDDNISWQCQIMVSPNDVRWWYLLTMSDYDISWRCQMMISPDNIRWWYHDLINLLAPAGETTWLWALVLRA